MNGVSSLCTLENLVLLRGYRVLTTLNTTRALAAGNWNDDKTTKSISQDALHHNQACSAFIVSSDHLRGTSRHIPIEIRSLALCILFE